MDYTFPMRMSKYHRRKSRVPPTMQEDRHGLLLDTGAIVNVHSDLWRRRYERVLIKNKLKVKENRRLATFSSINGKPCVGAKYNATYQSM